MAAGYTFTSSKLVQKNSAESTSLTGQKPAVMKTIQNPPKFKSMVELSEVIKIILLMLLATALICTEYYLGRSEKKTHSQNHIQESVCIDPGLTDYNNIEIHFTKE